MDEKEARFQLLLREMDTVQQGIQAMDSAIFKVKGWCITLAAAAAGVAISAQRPAFCLIGLAVVLSFWFVDGYYKGIQRIYIRRDLEIEDVMSLQDPLEVGGRFPSSSTANDGILVPGLAHRFMTIGRTRRARLVQEVRDTLGEAVKPIVYTVYLFVAVCLGITMIVI